MFKKYLNRILLALVLISFCSYCSECWIAQEMTQITVKIKAVAEWLNTLEMQLNQLKMLAQLPQSVINQINGMKELLSDNFSQVRNIFHQFESITHFTDDIENMLKPDILNGRLD